MLICPDHQREAKYMCTTKNCKVNSCVCSKKSCRTIHKHKDFIQFQEFQNITNERQKIIRLKKIQILKQLNQLKIKAINKQNQSNILKQKSKQNLNELIITQNKMMKQIIDRGEIKNPNQKEKKQNNQKYDIQENIPNANKKIQKKNIKIIEKINKKCQKNSELNLNQFFRKTDQILSLKYIDLTRIKILNLSENKLQNIQVISVLNMPLLQKLDLTKNFITSIEWQSNIPTFYFKKIILRDNKFQDLKSIKNLNAPNLQSLDLSKNNINDISDLKNATFKKLITLDLTHNQISEINSFRSVTFQKLQYLYLNYNILQNISAFPKISTFSNLKALGLSNNRIANLQPLEKVSILDLKVWGLGFNYIDNFDFLKKRIIPKQTDIYLHDNLITNPHKLIATEYQNFRICHFRNNKYIQGSGLKDLLKTKQNVLLIS